MNLKCFELKRAVESPAHNNKDTEQQYVSVSLSLTANQNPFKKLK